MKLVRNFPIVGVGASAGGGGCAQRIFPRLSVGSRLAFVVVTHLSPLRESLLHEVVARYTDLPVEIAAHGKQVDINCVYVMRANAIVRIDDGVLMVDTPADGRRPPKPIDIFFSSLAEDHGELSVGVVLSGGDADGTLGVKAIKEHGSPTLAQLPDGFGLQHPDMPESAISTGFVDFALPIHEMASKLMEFATLRRDAREVTALFRDLLINVTDFFRDADAFANLATHVGPMSLIHVSECKAFSA